MTKKLTCIVPAKKCLCGCGTLIPDLPGSTDYAGNYHRVKANRARISKQKRPSRERVPNGPTAERGLDKVVHPG